MTKAILAGIVDVMVTAPVPKEDVAQFMTYEPLIVSPRLPHASPRFPQRTQQTKSRRRVLCRTASSPWLPPLPTAWTWTSSWTSP